MRIWLNACVAVLQLGIAVALGSAGASAQTLVAGSLSIALKSGESTEIGNVFYVLNCQSLLKSTPEAEILEGPPGVTVTVKQAMVMARAQSCARPVPGGTLVITAKDIEDPSVSRLTIRITYKTKDGDRRFSHIFNLSLFP